MFWGGIGQSERTSVRATFPLVALAAAGSSRKRGGLWYLRGRPGRHPSLSARAGIRGGSRARPARGAARRGNRRGAVSRYRPCLPNLALPAGQLHLQSMGGAASRDGHATTEASGRAATRRGIRGSHDAESSSTHIIAFQEVDIGGGPSGLVEMDFCLRPVRPPSRTQWCQTFRRQTPASADSREAAVAAITTSFNGVIDELTAILDRQLQVPPEQAKDDTDESRPVRKRLRVPDRR